MLRRTVLLISLLSLFFITSYGQDLSNLGQQKPIRFTGSLEFKGIAYNVDGLTARRKPFTWYIFGSPTLTIYGLSIPFSFALSEENQTYSQPFNQFGLSPHYKWITVHLGYRNVNFSPYTLAGHTIYGAGLELNPGKLRFGFMYGRLNKATQVDSSTGYVRPVSFSRKCIAVKLGFGSKNNFFDISVLKAQDDSASATQAGLDSANLVLPAANLVGAAALKLRLGANFFLESDAGLSLYTNNMNSPHKIEELAKYSDILPINLSTQKYMATMSSLTYKIKYFSLKASYKWVEPGFRSMGAYFFANDVEQISLAPAFQLFKSRIRAGGSMGWQRDNLRNQKVMTTKRQIWSANAGFEISKQLGLDINLSNYSMNSKPEVTKLDNKYRLTNTTQSYGISPRYMLVKKFTSHMLLGNYTQTSMVDANDTTSFSNEIKNRIAFLSYSLNFLKEALSLNTTLNQTSTQFQGQETAYLGISLGANKGFFKNKLQAGGNISYTFSQSDAGSDILNVSLNSQYSMTKHHRFYVRLMVLNNMPNNKTLAPAFTESTGEIGYNFSF